MKSILITGGAGFIGSNFIIYFLEKYKNYQIINLDKLTYAGNLSNLKEIHENKNHIFIKGDICDTSLLKNIFETYDIQGVIHFAAESHVDNSISSPNHFIQTNINGTFHLLEIAKNHWQNAPFEYKKGYENCRFHHISTDEVFGSLSNEGYFSEESSYAPNSPYSASKAGADMLVRAYVHTYGLNCVTTNCSNNYGKKQHDEKLIPTIIRKAIQNEKIPIYGDGKNVRDWLSVTDHCKAIDLVFHQGKKGETYAIGGNCEKTNLDIVYFICNYLNKKIPKNKNYLEQITFVKDRAGHDKRYAIDSSKIKKELNWCPSENFETTLETTIDWYLEKYKNNEK